MDSDAFKARFTTEMLRALDVLETLDGRYDIGEIELETVRARVAIVEARTALLHLEVAYRQLEVLEHLTRKTEIGRGRQLAVLVDGEISVPKGVEP